nr:MAG TPA: hypothetical protein [Caudoviricetes sp.]
MRLGFFAAGYHRSNERRQGQAVELRKLLRPAFRKG